jgi:hypothetical protein
MRLPFLSRCHSVAEEVGRLLLLSPGANENGPPGDSVAQHVVRVASEPALSTHGSHRRGSTLVRVQSDYDGGGPAKGGRICPFVDDDPVGDARVERTQPLPFASDEPFEIGTDLGSPVSPKYHVRPFAGVVNWVEIEIPA